MGDVGLLSPAFFMVFVGCFEVLLTKTKYFPDLQGGACSGSLARANHKKFSIGGPYG